MAYKSNREKVKEFIENIILSWVKERDLDYYEIKELIMNETGASSSFVEEVIASFCKLNRIKEVRILTIPDEEVIGYFKELKEKKENIKKEIKEVFNEGSDKQEKGSNN